MKVRFIGEYFQKESLKRMKKENKRLNKRIEMEKER
jgi:hypothetical protein